jgi:hypothetical protein
MNIDFEDLLREGIDRLPAEVPAGLMHRAARQARRHRLVTRAGIAAAAATVTAAAVVIGVLSVAPTASRTAVPGISQSARPAPAKHPRPLPSRPAGPVTGATLVSRVEHAVLTSTKFIAYSPRYDYKDRSKLIVTGWSYQNMRLLVWPEPNAAATLVTTYPDLMTVKHVYYDSRQWSFSKFPPGYPFDHPVPTAKNQCVGPADDYPQTGDPQWAAWLVSSLRCGAYTITSHSGVNGTPILEIVNTPKDVDYLAGSRLHMLVDATTYLPIADWQAGSYGYYDVITWLPPTKALLAQIRLPVPPGFSRCQLSEPTCNRWQR